MRSIGLLCIITCLLKQTRSEMQIVYRSSNLPPACIQDDGAQGICVSVSKCFTTGGQMIGSCHLRNAFGVCCKTKQQTGKEPEGNSIQTDREDDNQNNLNQPIELSDPDEMSPSIQPAIVSEFHEQDHSEYHQSSYFPKTDATPVHNLVFEHHRFGAPYIPSPQAGSYGSQIPFIPGYSRYPPNKGKDRSVNLEAICGKAAFRSPHIVGGKRARPGEFPWQLSLRKITGYTSEPKCGATLIHPRWVITAAHCSQDIPIEYMVVRGGSLVIDSNQPSNASHTYIDATVRNIYPHPDFNFYLLKTDIALLELNTPFPVTDFLKPICLPPDGDLVGQTVTLTGWGKNATDGVLQSAMLKIDVPVITNQKCEEWYNRTRITTIEDTLFCAGLEKGGKDACVGDSGGPVQLKFDDRWTIVGIISWGSDLCGSAYQPSANTNINKFKDWITKTTKNEVYVPSFFDNYETIKLNIPDETTIVTIPDITTVYPDATTLDYPEATTAAAVEPVTMKMKKKDLESTRTWNNKYRYNTKRPNKKRKKPMIFPSK